MPFVSSVRGSFGPQARLRRNYNQGMLNRITGGTVTTAGGYRIHTFTSGSTSFDTSQFGELTPEILLVGGGGSGGTIGGGGGAGGYVYGSKIVPAASNTITVGAGGPAFSGNHGPRGNDGGASSGLGWTANGGGAGGGWSQTTGNQGGSGGGGSGNEVGAASNQSFQSGSSISAGFAGGASGNSGDGNTGSGLHTSGGGGGAGGTGLGRRGGLGLVSSISGAIVGYAGGGGGGSHTSGLNSSYSVTLAPGAQALYGAGYGGSVDNSAIGVGTNNGQNAQRANSGSGGGGSFYSGPSEVTGAGAAGIVIIRYPI